MASHRFVAAEAESMTLLTPPETLAPGRFCLIQRVALMKSTA